MSMCLSSNPFVANEWYSVFRAFPSSIISTFYKLSIKCLWRSKKWKSSNYYWTCCWMYLIHNVIWEHVTTPNRNSMDCNLVAFFYRFFSILHWNTFETWTEKYNIDNVFISWNWFTILPLLCMHASCVYKHLPFLVNCAPSIHTRHTHFNIYKMKSCLMWFICLFIEFVPYQNNNNDDEVHQLQCEHSVCCELNAEKERILLITWGITHNTNTKCLGFHSLVKRA